MKSILRIKIQDQYVDKRGSTTKGKDTPEIIPVMSPKASKLQTPVSTFLGFRSQHAQHQSGFSFALEEEINEDFAFSNDNDLTTAIQILNKDPSKRTHRDLKLIQKAIVKTSLYEYYKPFLDEEQRFDKLCMKLQYTYFNPYQEIISYGEMPRKMFILMKGSAWVIVPSQSIDKEIERRVKDKISQAQLQGSTDLYCFVKAEDYIIYKNPQYKIVNEIEGPTHIGDQALRYRCNRTSSIFSKTTVHLASLDVKDFNEIFMQFDTKKINYYYPHYRVIALFKKNDLFSKFDDSIVESIVRSSDRLYLSRSQIIYNQGDNNDYLYFIEDGEVELKQKNDHSQDSPLLFMNEPHRLIQKIEMEEKTALLSTNCRRKYRDSFQKAESYRYIAVLSAGEIFGEDFTESKVRMYQAVCKSVKLILYRIRISVFTKYYEMIGRKQKAVLKTKQDWRNQLKNKTQLVQNQFDTTSQIDHQQLVDIQRKSSQFIYYDAFSEEKNTKNTFNVPSKINSYYNITIPNQSQTTKQSPQLNPSNEIINRNRQLSRLSLNSQSQHTQPTMQSARILLNTSDENFYGGDETFRSTKNQCSIKNFSNNTLQLNRLAPNYQSMRDLRLDRQKMRHNSTREIHSIVEHESSIINIEKEETANNIDSNNGNKFTSTMDNISFINSSRFKSSQQELLSPDQGGYFAGSQLNPLIQHKSQQSLSKHEQGNFYRISQRDLPQSESQRELSNQNGVISIKSPLSDRNHTIKKLNLNKKPIKKVSLLTLNKISTHLNSDSRLNTNTSFDKQNSEIEKILADDKRQHIKTLEDNQNDQDQDQQQLSRSQSIKLTLPLNLLKRNRTKKSTQFTPTSPDQVGDDNEDKSVERLEKDYANQLYNVYKFNDTITTTTTDEKQKKEAIVITNEYYLKQISRKMKEIHDQKFKQKKEHHFNPFSLSQDHNIPVLKQLKIDEIFPNSSYADQTKKGMKDINKILQDDHAQQLEESNVVRIKRKLPTMINDQISKNDIIDLVISPKTKKDSKIQNLLETQLNNYDSRIYLKLLLEKIEKEDSSKIPSIYNFVPQGEQKKLKLRKSQLTQKISQYSNIKLEE